MDLEVEGEEEGLEVALPEEEAEDLVDQTLWVLAVERMVSCIETF